MTILIAICAPILAFVVAFTLSGILGSPVAEGERRRRPDIGTYLQLAMILGAALVIVDYPILEPLFLQYVLFFILPAGLGFVLWRGLSRRAA